ncbi:MAG: OmpP1/FadL family transporter [Rhodospirillales bacterium]|nr:OmpP1/FadL family transporter [Rhodospirillales bacterium]MDH3792201.1 OmpP1/FadL family transporter [Rhodospirillales bacterium]MDH3909828.1 OmpP1/FadL family transporter [Rhodospirillales bacterium]MDH3966693.1 OmpP1/FadL family transporter [Rhodospirillales bacterium]
MKTTKSGRTLACALVALPALVLSAQHALAAGYAIKEQSGSALGNAFAGAVTGIDDITYSFYNPAMMTYLSGNHAALSNSYIIPNAKFKNGSASTVTTAPINNTSRFKGNDDIGRDALVPAVYGMWSYDENLKFGLSITAPFGLLTDNPDGWQGRYHALKSDLKTFDINPAVAYRVMPGLSIGAGFRALYADAELSNAVDYGTIAGGSSNELTDGRAKLQGDDWGFGFNVGVMYEPIDKLRLGVAYRSSIDVDIEGDTKFDLDQAGVGAALQAGLGLFLDTDATASVDLPDSVAFGANYDLTGEWSVMAQAEWWNWSKFDELRVEFDNPNQPDNVTEEDWNDSWFFAVGTTYKPKQVEGLALRLGLAFDESPIPDKTRTPRIPGEDRYWIAAGIGYTPLPWLTLDLGYTHIFVNDADIDLKATPTNDNTFRGNLSGKYEAHIDIIALQATARF